MRYGTEIDNPGAIVRISRLCNILLKIYVVIVYFLETDVFVVFCKLIVLFEPHHEKTNNLHMRKQRRRPASR